MRPLRGSHRSLRQHSKLTTRARRQFERSVARAAGGKKQKRGRVVPSREKRESRSGCAFFFFFFPVSSPSSPFFSSSPPQQRNTTSEPQEARDSTIVIRMMRAGRGIRCRKTNQSDLMGTTESFVKPTFFRGRRLDARAFFSFSQAPLLRDDFAYASEHQIPCLSCLDALDWSSVSAEWSIGRRENQARPGDAETGFPIQSRFFLVFSPAAVSPLARSSPLPIKGRKKREKRTSLFLSLLSHAALFLSPPLFR